MSRGTEIDLLYNAILNGPAVQLTRYPANAAGQALTASGMTTGAYKYAAAGANQVQTTGLTAALNTAGVWVAGATLTALSVAGIFVMWIGRGTIPAGVRAAELSFEAHGSGAAAADTLAGLVKTTWFPIPLFVQAGVGVAEDLASSNAGQDDTAAGAIYAYTGLGA